MFGQKKSQAEEVPQPLLHETRALGPLTQEANRWLGGRYQWYNKIREAKKGHLPFLENKSLEEQMEATRSALTLLDRTIGTGLVLAFNSTREAIGKLESAPEGLPEKIEIPDRSNPPRVTDEHDALTLSFMPMRYLNLAKMARDKGKGIDFYTEGVVKKFYFKVIGFYCDPHNWQPERQAFFLRDLPADTPLATYGERLAPLKTELEIFASTFQSFSFGTQYRSQGGPGMGNTMDETFQETAKEQVMDLYFQSFLINGMANFLFRYYVTLVTAVQNPKALRLVSGIFQGALAKVEEVRLRFQASFAMEKAKIRLRQPYQEFYKHMEARPITETVKEKKREVRRINYIHKLQELTALSFTGHLNEKQSQRWSEVLTRDVVGRAESGVGGAVLMEILNMMLRTTRFSVDGKLQVVESLKKFTEEQETLGKRNLAAKKKMVQEAKRKKIRTASKFRSTKQFDMVKTIEEEAAQIETQGEAEIASFEAAIAKRKDALSERAQTLEATAINEGERDLARSASEIFALLGPLDEGGHAHQAFVQHVLGHIQEDNELTYLEFYKNLFGIAPDLAPTEKFVLRKALESRVELEEGEMPISAEDRQAYEQNILTMKTEINMEAPGALEQRFMHKTVNTTVGALLEASLTQESLGLLLSLPVNPPSKPAAKLPAAVVKKMLWLNQLTHPFAENDIILPNVDAAEPVEKRVNFNRLDKVIG